MVQLLTTRASGELSSSIDSVNTRSIQRAVSSRRCLALATCHWQRVWFGYASSARIGARGQVQRPRGGWGMCALRCAPAALRSRCALRCDAKRLRQLRPITHLLPPHHHQTTQTPTTTAIRPMGASAGRRLAVRVSAAKQLKDRTTVKGGAPAPADSSGERVCFFFRVGRCDDEIDE